MPYWQAPDRLYDEPEDFAGWARDAFEVAVRTQKKPKGGKSAKPARKATARKTSVAGKR
jgi:DNA transformation protein and related proteins